jgi:hypothetical protein
MCCQCDKAKKIRILSDTINSERGYWHIPAPCLKYKGNVEKEWKMVKPPTRELRSSMFALRKMFGDGTSNRPFSR